MREKVRLAARPDVTVYLGKIPPKDGSIQREIYEGNARRKLEYGVRGNIRYDELARLRPDDSPPYGVQLLDEAICPHLQLETVELAGGHPAPLPRERVSVLL